MFFFALKLLLATVPMCNIPSYSISINIFCWCRLNWNRIRSTACLWGLTRKSFHILFLSGILLREYKIPYRSRIIFRGVSEGFDCLVETRHWFQWNHPEIHNTLQSVSYFGVKIEIFWNMTTVKWHYLIHASRNWQ